MRVPDFRDIVAASNRLSGIVRNTPMLTSPIIDERLGANLFFKPECLQHTGSFKIRGAMNRLLSLTPGEKKNGVVAFSSGNHAQGIARAARWLDMPALIVMPSDAPKVKIEGVRADGADIRFYDRTHESREIIAEDIARERGAVLVPSFDDPYVIAGQGTVGVEVAEQMKSQGAPLDYLVCCTGGGGLISGIALAMNKLSPSTEIWTAEPDGYDDWARSLQAGERVANSPNAPATLCDAILTPMPGELTFKIGKRLLAGGLVAAENDVRLAMQMAFRDLKLVVEPGGAAAFASLLSQMPTAWKGARIGVVLSGGNVDPSQFRDIL